MPFKKGHEKVGGKVKGTPNKLTQEMRSVKEVVLNAFNEIQEDPKANIITWGKENPKDFYTIAAKLIPTELNAKVTDTNLPLISWVQPTDKDPNDKPE